MLLFKKLISIILLSAVVYSFAYVIILTASISSQIKSSELMPVHDSNSEDVSEVLSHLKTQRAEYFEGDFGEDLTLHIVQLEEDEQPFGKAQNHELNETEVNLSQCLSTPFYVTHHFASFIIYSVVVYFVAAIIHILLKSSVKSGRLLVITSAITSSPFTIFMAVGLTQIVISCLPFTQYIHFATVLITTL
ncbi:hypothetical protein F7Q91_03255 [Vibrio chagasii]|uniref:Uncharacterized protein n=1 Tax=Vibrio chagasii TaxID=170679 RepID=A0A7V7NWZ4_9VIBR|nr:hypothetical protein [Vibrio chagasii]KAB0482439.1 hypothetical protein F7Q91_03255 [Vibrio chagasii]